MPAPKVDLYKLGYQPQLDGFRGVAVLMVLLGHIGISQVARAGTVGVTLFFVLSGFLITRLLVEERARAGRVDFPRFYLRRALRLFPAMVVFLTVVGIYGAVSGANAPIGYPALYLANVAQAAGRDLGLVGHTWSLSLEEQFYLVWPALLVLAVTRRRALAMAGIGVLASFGATILLIATDRSGLGWERINFGPDTRASALFIGCALGLTIDSCVRLRAVGLLGPPSLAAIATIALVSRDKSAVFYLVALPLASVLGALVIVYLLDGARAAARLAGWQPLVGVGRISYGLYLWHFPVFIVLRPHLQWLPFPLRASILIAVSLGVASAAYFGVERYFLRLKDRMVPRQQSDPAAGLRT